MGLCVDFNMSNLPHFEKLFPAKNFKNNSGWLFWGEEIEKWLAFIDDKDSGYYKENENKFCGEKQCDEPLGEYKAAYFIEKMCGGSIVEFRPRWQKNSELDFRFQDKNEIARQRIAGGVDYGKIGGIERRITGPGACRTGAGAENACPAP